MKKLYSGKINCSVIDKARLFEGKKGKWADIEIWLSDEPNQFGNHVSIQQSVQKDEAKIYLGEAKLKWEEKPKTEPESSGEWKGKKEVKSMSDSSELPQLEENPDNLSF
jgi:hypothetical protein